MKEEKGGTENQMKNAFETINETEATFYFNEWIGAIFYYLLNLTRKLFAQLIKLKHRTRNVLTDYVISLLVEVIFMYVVFRFY